MSLAHGLPPTSLATWAEVVPTRGPVAVDILLTLPDDRYVYEIVEGVLIHMAGSGNRATRLAARLTARLLDYVEAQALGAVTTANGVYTFPGAETGLIPDVGYYVAAKATLIKDDNKLIPFAPDLAIEVASPSQDAGDMAAKARVYLNAGTRLVWVVWPHRSHIDVWRVGDRRGPSATLGRGDTLDGEDVVPGFAYPVAGIFADPLNPAPE